MSEVKLVRNLNTGVVEAFKDGNKIGEVKTMGDEMENANDYKA